MQIEKSAFPTPWSQDNVARQISNPRALFLVAQYKGAIAAFSLNWIVADEVHMLKFAVEERYKRQGIGRLIFASTCEEAVKKDCRVIWLEVREGNTIAQAFYNCMEFTTVGRRNGYYSDTEEDALVMCRKIP